MTHENKPNAATQAKKRWNAKNYAVIKISAEPDVAAAFKAACLTSNVSMNSTLIQFMSQYSNVAKKHKPANDFSSRRQRRSAVKSIALQMERIRDAEERCRDNIPDNLQGSSVYDAADELVSLLGDVIDMLNSIY